MGIRYSELLVQSDFRTNERGIPTGGETTMHVAEDGSLVPVIAIRWQSGIIPPGSVQNGAFVEDVIEAARQRIQFFNSSPLTRCRENSLAITKLEEALQWLDWRTRNRVNQGVENTYEQHEDGGAPNG